MMYSRFLLQCLAACAALAGAAVASAQATLPPGAAAGKSAAAGLANPAAAAVVVRDAWIRQTVPGQSGTGAFMKLTSQSGAKLVGVSTPAAGIAEVHEMKMEGDTMKMRELAEGLALPAGQTVELRPGGNHVMLMDLKQPLPKGTMVPLTLEFEDAKGRRSVQVQVPVGTPAGGAGATHRH